MKRIPRPTTSRLAIFVLLGCVLPNIATLHAWDDPSRTSHDAGLKDVQPDGIRGTLVLVGSGNLPEPAVAAFVSAVGDQGTALVITGDADESNPEASHTPPWIVEAGVPHTVFIGNASDGAANAPALSAAINSVRGVWITDRAASRLATVGHRGDVAASFQKLLDRGGVIGGASAGAAVLSQTILDWKASPPTSADGFKLLSGAVVVADDSKRQRSRRLQTALEESPGTFGLALDQDTAVVVQGRRMQVVGAGEVTLALAKCGYRDREQLRLANKSIADLTQWTRAARTRQLGIDPGTPRLGVPQVKSGSLVIVGGGRMPKSVADRFIELAGGPKARIVYLPTAVPRDEARKQGVPRFLEQAEIADVTVLPQMGQREVAEPAFQEALKSATGIWFGGGRQWNFVDAYEGSNAIALFHNVLARGGVIGGSSAGATIQGEFLVRGHPLGNTIMMAEGYERGFGFMPGTAIDQHFTQRRRQPDLIPVVRQHPKLLGIGIDESTALIVQGHTAEVLGDHAVHFLTSDKLPAADNADSPASSADEDNSATGADDVAAAAASLYHTVKSGESFDLRDLTRAE